MEQGYGDEPPTDYQHCVSHLRGAAVDNQVDDQQKAETRRGNSEAHSNPPFNDQSRPRGLFSFSAAPQSVERKSGALFTTI